MQTNNKQRTIQWARYIITMVLTVAIFGSALYVSQVATNNRLTEVRSIQDKIAIDLLSSETQFSLLSNVGCTQDGNSILAPEIGQLGDRLTFMENQLGIDDPNVIGLKKYYSLLQIKDYMLTKELDEKCNFKPVTLVYFYSNEDCTDCTKQGYVLTALRQKYPLLRVYSFDANLDLSAIKTLQTVTKAPGTLPSMVIGGKVYTGFKSIEEIEKAVPALAKMLADQKVVDEKTKKAEVTKNTQ
jgi:hypothetical protein